VARQGPRGPDGRFVCVPSYPRLRTSSCGCGGGGLHPCPVGKKLRPVREAAKRRYVPSREEDLQEIEDLERELYGVEVEREANDAALAEIRGRIQSAGSLAHRARDQGQHGNTSRGRGYSAIDRYGEDSERGYEDLLAERQQMRAHGEHLKREARDLKGLIAKIRRGHLAGAARRRAVANRYRAPGRTADRAVRRAGMR